MLNQSQVRRGQTKPKTVHDRIAMQANRINHLDRLWDSREAPDLAALIKHAIEHARKYSRPTFTYQGKLYRRSVTSFGRVIVYDMNGQKLGSSSLGVL